MEERDMRRALIERVKEICEQTKIERVKEIYEQTKSAARVHGYITNWFWTRKGITQGCSLCPLLFELVIADMEGEMKKG